VKYTDKAAINAGIAPAIILESFTDAHISPQLITL